MDKSEVQPSTCSGDDRRQNVNRIILITKGTKIWYEWNLFGIRKRPNLSNGIKAAYWSCSHARCNVTFKTAGMGTLDGFEWARNKEHSHPSKTWEVIRMEMWRLKRYTWACNTWAIWRSLLSTMWSSWVPIFTCSPTLALLVESLSYPDWLLWFLTVSYWTSSWTSFCSINIVHSLCSCFFNPVSALFDGGTLVLTHSALHSLL